MSDGNFCAHCGALIYYGPHLCYGQTSQTVPVQHPHTTMVTPDAGLEIQGPVFQQVMDELAALRARHEKLLNLPRWVHMKHNPNFEHPNGDWVRYADIRAALEDE